MWSLRASKPQENCSRLIENSRYKQENEKQLNKQENLARKEVLQNDESILQVDRGAADQDHEDEVTLVEKAQKKIIKQEKRKRERFCVKNVLDYE